MTEFVLDNPQLLAMRRACKVGNLDELAKLARQHPADGMNLLVRTISIRERAYAHKRKQYESEIDVLRRALNDRLTPAELDKIKQLALSRGEELRRRFCLRGLA